MCPSQVNRRAAGERRKSALEASDNGGAEKAGAERVGRGEGAHFQITIAYIYMYLLQ